MRLRSLQLLFALVIGSFSVPTLYPQTIEANNSQSPQTITSTDILSIAISHTGGSPPDDHDWWIAVVTSLPSPNDIYYYDGTSWTTEFSVAFQQPLTEINSLELLNGSGIPPAIMFSISVSIRLPMGCSILIRWFTTASVSFPRLPLQPMNRTVVIAGRYSAWIPCRVMPIPR